MKTALGITEQHLENSTKLLSALLGDEMTLYIKTRKFDWDIASESFLELHKLFQCQCIELEETIDLVKEHINKLGGKTIGSMKEFGEHTRLEESFGKCSLQNDMMKELLSDHELMAVELRKDIETCANKNNDAGTTDLLTGLLQQHETAAWVLRRYLG